MRFIFVLFFICNEAIAQSDRSIVRTITDLPAKEPFDTARSYYKAGKPYLYIISDKDVYDWFGYDISMKLREFDFTNFHILGLQKGKEWSWFVRENKKAFTEIPCTTLPGHVKTYLPKDRTSFWRDTIINSSADPNEALWFTSAHGDCHAYFKFSLFIDKYHPVLLMKEWNYWGGCRAAGSWNFTLSFKKPKGILHYEKNIILMEKDYRGL